MKPKTKYCKLGIACILVFLLIAGCASKDRIDSGPRPVSQTPAQGENQMVAGPAGGTGYVAPVVEEQSTPVEVSADVGEQQKARDEIGLTDTGIEQTKSLQTGRYCYDTMDAQYHTLYVELLTIVENSQENIRISTDNADALQYAFLCMFYDHPEIFWIDGYTYMRHEDSTGSYFTFSGRYTYTREESAGYQLALDQYFAQVQATIPANASQYEKVKGVYEYIVRHTEYDPTA
ncbi:MAG TPA: hypothetical protein PLQ04_10335, partial [Lachnospiraceae bacterium]|nr:hypothetical protein [Lachnospiraceae bacterium]